MFKHEKSELRITNGFFVDKATANRCFFAHLYLLWYDPTINRLLVLINFLISFVLFMLWYLSIIFNIVSSCIAISNKSLMPDDDYIMT
jgi:hypothetical protein